MAGSVFAAMLVAVLAGTAQAGHGTIRETASSITVEYTGDTEEISADQRRREEERLHEEQEKAKAAQTTIKKENLARYKETQREEARKNGD